MSKNSVSQLQDALLILKSLDGALSMHLHWLKELHRILICDEPPRPADIASDAHRLCGFGGWFYGLPAAQRQGLPALDGMEEPHRVMHDAARRMLLVHRQGETIATADYELFMDLALAFKMSLMNCQNYLIGQVCTVDHLTGVWNRHAMSMRLSEERERARRSHAPCCLCLLDLDHFKRINDSYGHGAGDAVLQAVSRFLKDRIRPYDSLFRYGGEEFLICLPNTAAASAAALLNRLREELAALSIVVADGQALCVTASFGVAQLDLAAEVEAGIECVDHALLCAKAQGRNCVCCWDTMTILPAG